MMKIIPATQQLAEVHQQGIADLVHQTGPVPYDYQFGSKGLLDRIVKGSLPVEKTLFGFDGLTLAMEEGALVGILYSFQGPEFQERKAGLTQVMTDMVSNKELSIDEVTGLAERAGHAQWLNPVVRNSIYYIHAVAVTPESRGRKFGVELIQHAMNMGREQGCKGLELDVMSDNPAVNFYQSQGLEILAQTTAPKPRAYGVPAENRMGVKLK